MGSVAMVNFSKYEEEKLDLKEVVEEWKENTDKFPKYYSITETKQTYQDDTITLMNLVLGRLKKHQSWAKHAIEKRL